MKRDQYRCSDDSGHDAEGKGFDELVVGEWFHMERMDSGSWWLKIGERAFFVKAGRGGAKMIQQDGPPVTEGLT